MATEVAKRSEIAFEDTWATEEIFPTDEAWEEELARVTARIGEAEKYRGHIGDSAEMLLEYLDFEDSMDMDVETLYMYAHLKSDVDTADSTYQNMHMKAQMLFAQYVEAMSFAEPEIQAIPADTLAGYRASLEGFAPYARRFEVMERERAHTRSAEIEELLASTAEMSSTPANAFTMFNNADLKFGTILDENGEETELTHGRYIGFMQSTDRRVRKDAFEKMYQAFGGYVNTVAALFSGNIKQDIFHAKARHYANTRAMHLSSGNIPEEVYDNLIQVVHEGLPAMYRYVALRKKMLGVEELHMYDVYVPIVEESKATFTFEEARDTIFAALEPMGETYLSALRHGFESRWIDAKENQGKRSGAYCSGGTTTHPYVLLTFKNDLESVYTLAHEMGHAMHSYFSNETQPHQTRDYLIFVAEVASTCNEILLTKYLLAHSSDKAEKMFIVNHFLDSLKGTLYRQTMFAEFEMIMHRMLEEDQPLTADVINEVYYKLNEQYFGPDMVSDDAIRLEWARIPHFYTPFYVYQYATGISAAAALADRVLTLGEAGVADYMKFLRAGGSMDPIDILKMAGVDMSKKEPVQAAVKLFEDMLTELEALVNE